MFGILFELDEDETRIACSENKFSNVFASAFRWLRDKFGVKRLLCEGGGETNAALIRAGVVDEMHITICPLVLRGQLAPNICAVKAWIPQSVRRR